MTDFSRTLRSFADVVRADVERVKRAGRWRRIQNFELLNLVVEVNERNARVDARRPGLRAADREIVAAERAWLDRSQV